MTGVGGGSPAPAFDIGEPDMKFGVGGIMAFGGLPVPLDGNAGEAACAPGGDCSEKSGTGK